MVDHSSKDGHASTKASFSSESGVRKFTQSCARCRASKLKCDREEPCMECVKRNVGHLCTKDERQPRVKRAKTDNSGRRDPETNALENQGTEADEAAQVLEDFVDGTSRTNAYPSAVSKQTLSYVAPEYPNVYWLNANNPQRQGVQLALIREIVDAMPGLDMIRLLYQVFVTRCQGPLGNIVHTPTFMKHAETFCGCLSLASSEAQVTALSNTISMDAIACHLLALVLALAFHPTPSLLGWSPSPLTLYVEEVRASDVHSRTWRSLALRCLQGEVSLFCGSIASLQAAIMLLLQGQGGSLALDAILVNAISGAQKLGLHRLGDAKLVASASPISFPEDSPLMSTEPPHVRTEIGVRIWWALVMRDWSRGQALDYYSIHPSQFNTRVPLHINDDDLCPTTLAINVHGYITERPRSEFTMLSYTVHALEIAAFARESIDLRGPFSQAPRQEKTTEGAKMRHHLNKQYENFVAGLPSYFRLGSTMGLTSTGPMAAIPVQRWMLHQQLWSLFLRLHRASLSSQDGRSSCQLLAQNIISSQGQIQARCAVCGSLSTSETQLFNAAIVLILDLLFSSKHKGVDCSGAQLSRLMTRDKIREAIELLRTRNGLEGPPSLQDPQLEQDKASTRRSFLALEALMRLEEEESDNNEEGNGAKSTGNRPGGQGGQGVRSDSNARKSLKNKVMDTLDSLQGNTLNASTTAEEANLNSIFALDMSMPLATTTGGFQDFDVLPMLSNDPGYDFWQSLEIATPKSPTENGYFSATADMQNLSGLVPLRQSSGAAQSLSSFGTPEFGDVYSNIDGTRVIHASPSSIASGPTKLSGRSEAATTPSSADAYVAAKFLLTYASGDGSRSSL